MQEYTDFGNAKMNITYPPTYTQNVPLALQQLGYEFVKAATYFLIPAELLYFAVYFLRKDFYKVYRILTFLSLATLWTAPFLAPISCGSARCLQNLAGMFCALRMYSMFLKFWADNLQLR